ncbi:hypothetical protein [Nocardioides pocheonensis]|uniref:Uncharacterized protein n=1 Tax=Nocardioides pocheonensis TaxID=661485 RepID=A0A3N0GX09_9ACTN|nr:hypothetical protein [Nocardioides pocheonensis]RNM16961.1 hypothetical protein EFL26_02420 [Nocardioides pocheonensis]
MSTDATTAATVVRPSSRGPRVLVRNQKYLRDPAGRLITDGTCVVDADGEVGYVRLQLAPFFLGPESWEWDGWFHVTRTRSENPLRGKLAVSGSVRVLSQARR